jgi:hypothetical protein
MHLENASNRGLVAGAAFSMLSIAGMAEAMYQTKGAGLEYAGHKNKEFQDLAKIIGVKKVEKALAPAATPAP